MWSIVIFPGLYVLENLNLYKNDIDYIEPASFSDLISLQGLSLRNNDLKTVSEFVFNVSNHPALMSISLAYNPLECNESLSWLKQVRYNYMVQC